MKSREFEFKESDEYYYEGFDDLCEESDVPITKCNIFLKNHGFKKIRTVTVNSEASSKYSEIWFVAVDICRLLGITNTSRAVKKFDIDERRKVRLCLPGGWYNIVSEAGVYRLITECRKPEVKKFQDYYYKYILHDIVVNGYKTFTPRVSDYIYKHAKYRKMSIKQHRIWRKQIDMNILKSEAKVFCEVIRDIDSPKYEKIKGEDPEYWYESMCDVDIDEYMEDYYARKITATYCAMSSAIPLMIKTNLYSVEHFNAGVRGIKEIRRTYSQYGWVVTAQPFHTVDYTNVINTGSYECFSWSVNTLWFKGDMYNVFDLINARGDIEKLHVMRNVSSTGLIVKGDN